MDYRELVDAAVRVRSQAYAPYSKFLVGAALLCADGHIITGCNVENASYPLSLCAERAAVAAAVAKGCRRFVAVAIVGGGEPAPPCGGCRQVLMEFGDMTVVLGTTAGDREPAVYPLSGLLPVHFGRGG